jgi:hypothetical protein
VISLSMDFLAKSWLPRALPLQVGMNPQFETRQAYHVKCNPRHAQSQ